MNFENTLSTSVNEADGGHSVNTEVEVPIENLKNEIDSEFFVSEGAYIDNRGRKWKLITDLADELRVSYGLIERSANEKIQKLAVPNTKRIGKYCDEGLVKTSLKDFISYPQVDKNTDKYIDTNDNTWVSISTFGKDWETSLGVIYRKVADLEVVRGRKAGGKEVNLYKESDLLDAVGAYLLLPSVDEKSGMYIDPQGISWISVNDTVRKHGIGEVLLRNALKETTSIQGKDSKMKKEVVLYQKQDVEKIVEDYYKLPELDERTGRYIDEKKITWMPLSIYADETGLDRPGIAVAAKAMDALPSRYNGGSVLFREDQLNERYSKVLEVPKVDPKTERYTDENEKKWIGIQTASNESGLGHKTIRRLAKSLQSKKLRNTIGPPFQGYPETELVNILDAYKKLPRVDSDTNEYVDEDGETWMPEQALREKYGTEVFMNYLGQVGKIEGRSRRSESILYNKKEVDQKMSDYFKLTRLNDEENFLDEKEIRWATLKAIASEFNVGVEAVRDRTKSIDSVEALNIKGQYVKAYPIEKLRQAFTDFPYQERKKNKEKITAEVLVENLSEYSDGSLREELIEMASLFGASKIIDILFVLHPEYRGVPVDQVKSTLGNYLGDFLVSPLPFNFDVLEKGLHILAFPDFRASLAEVIKSSCLSNLHEQKSFQKSRPDYQIVLDYIQVLQEKAQSLNSKDFNEILSQTATYFDSVFNGVQKSERVIDSLRAGRDFPDTFQKINIQEIRTKKRILLADEMGIGKSASAILAKESLGLKQAIVIVPSNVLSTWEEYLSDRIADSGEQQGYFKLGEAPRSLRVREEEDLDRSDIDSFEYVLVSQERLTKECGEKLKALNSDMLIIDEVHKLKNVRDGARSNCLMDLSESHQGDGKYLVALSGTPVPNKVEDIAISLKLLYPEKFSNINARELVSQIIQSDVLTLRNLLMQRMQMKSLAESVEMPQLNELIVMIELSEPEKELYQVLLEEDEVDAGSKMALLRKFLLNPASLGAQPSIESAKQSALEIRLHDFFSRKDKMVLFVNGYMEGIIRGQDNFLSTLKLPEGVTVRVIEGNVTTGREKIQDEFQESDQKILLVVSGQTADVGINLSSAQGVIEYNEPWTMADKRQQVARAHRFGILEELEYSTLITKGTIEEGIHEYILEKERVITKLIKGIPITEIEQNLIRESEKLDELNLEVNRDLAEYYFSSWNKMMQIFASVKELGEEKFSGFLSKYGEDYAECYSELGSRSYQANVNRVAGTIIANMAMDAKKPANEQAILDVASGPEMLLQHIPQECQEAVIGVDRNPYQLRGSDSGRALAGSFTKLPLQSGSFDYVNLALGLHYTRLLPSKEIYERLEVLTELNRVLKKGGKAVLSFIYSLDVKNERQFEEIVEAFGFHVVPEYTGETTSGENYKTKIVTLEKKSDIVDSIEEIVDILLEGDLDGVKFAKSDRRLKDSRRTINHFDLNGKRIDIRFNDMDFKAYKEERELTDLAEQMKIRAGGEIKYIPTEEIIRNGFTRFYNGKRYILYKKLSVAPGSVVLR